MDKRPAGGDGHVPTVMAPRFYVSFRVSFPPLSGANNADEPAGADPETSTERVPVRKCILRTAAGDDKSIKALFHLYD